ncbi:MULTISPECIES: hypothetical protein [unclassified Rhodococcus (in: high G+C Gram-positive bacteria)]|uniref:hypothetical protein n=1 Tax=unclassified Rhodococcus (in: high G+C Gram-positive bacteria) TaxID=192944 RepID=UPI00233F0836|nr:MULTISPECIES: hypothetical protein [unclassified Rhodococcus (in: high G+C Gram-positive bacteria)]WSE25285.1 hypothetical protein U9J23_24445 [Rhodococcus sp. PD04]
MAGTAARFRSESTRCNYAADIDTFRTFNGGPPDVVFMVYDPDHVGSKYTRGTGEYVDDYDDSIARTQQYQLR